MNNRFQPPHTWRLSPFFVCSGTYTTIENSEVPKSHFASVADIHNMTYIIVRLRIVNSPTSYKLHYLIGSRNVDEHLGMSKEY